MFGRCFKLRYATKPRSTYIGNVGVLSLSLSATQQYTTTTHIHTPARACITTMERRIEAYSLGFDFILGGVAVYEPDVLQMIR